MTPRTPTPNPAATPTPAPPPPSHADPHLRVLRHPYTEVVPLAEIPEGLRAVGRKPGSALIWHPGPEPTAEEWRTVARRPGGMALIVIFPEGGPPISDALLQAVHATRPLAILPHHDPLSPDELGQVLRRPPQDLGVEVTEYLHWRGLGVDRETTRIIRRTVELSAELCSVSGLSRSLYLSRRALGRRFMSRGLPVPSHWLHVARLLRVTVRLQNSEESVLTVGYELGYPDAFSLSNQMRRLTGYRPTDARNFLGWEWLLEAWLRREADTGGLCPDYTVQVLTQAGPSGRPAGSRKEAGDGRAVG